MLKPRLQRIDVGRRLIAMLALAACAQFGSESALAQFYSQPAAAPTSNPSAPQPVPQAHEQIQAYPLNDQTRRVLTAWQQYASGRQDLRIALDERTSQALVFAAPETHAQIRQQLGVQAQQVAAVNANTQPGQPAGSLPAANSGEMVLHHLKAAELHPRLEKVLSRQLPATVDVSGEWQSFMVEAAQGAAVSLNVNTRTGQVRIDGPPAQAAAWRSVIAALDSPPAAPGSVTQLVATKPANHERVRKTLQALQASGGQAKPENSLVATLMQQVEANNNQPAQAETAPPQNGEQAPAAAPGSQLQTALDAAKMAEAAGSLLGPVQVEFVEGLDIIVLRGSERDVERVMEIIEQIEELSAVTVPAIEIVELKFIDSLQMAALLTRLYEQILGPRIGTVSITPLGRPNALLLVGRPENVKMAIELIQRLDVPAAPTARFQVFPLQHASALEAKVLVDSFLGQQEDQELPDDAVTEATEDIPTLAPRALVVADARTNSLIVSAGPRDLAEIAALLERIDRPGATAELKVFTIVNGDAQALAQVLRSLFSIPATGEAAEDGGGLGQGGPVRMQFSVDSRTNSIVAAGSREDLAVVEAILLRLDEGDLRERMTTVHRLNNAFAQNVAVALNQWLQTQRQVEAQLEVGVSPFEQISREVIIVPELATNSLIVSATPRYYEELIRVIRELDERPPMVLIQVLIAEVRLNDTDEFGVELGLQDSLLFDRSLLSDVQTITETFSNPATGIQTSTQRIISGAGQPGFNWNNAPLGNNVVGTQALASADNVGTQGLSSFSLGRANADLGYGGFVFSASSSSVNVLLRALQEKRRLEVLSRPQLMALDGQPGQVQVGQNVPRIVATSVDPLAGTTNTITYEPVGLILQVVPRISPDGLVVMQITANKSEVGPEAEGIPISISPQGLPLRAPRIDVTQAITTVSALSGQTVVLGGLLQTRRFDVHRRVPIIADIPLLGNLFRYDSVSEQRVELLIVLTPQIIYNKTDSDLVKQIESSRMSWILSDVVNLHGEAGLRSRCDEWADGEIDALYPTYVPDEGILPLSSGERMNMEGCPPDGIDCETVYPSPQSIDGPAMELPEPAAPPAPPVPNGNGNGR